MIQVNNNITRNSRVLNKNANLEDLEKLYNESTLSPVGYYMHVIPVPMSETTESGLVIPDSVQDDMATIMTVGKVVKMGTECYDAKDKPWCEEGDFVIFHKHKGSRLEIKGVVVVILTDDQVIGVIDDPKEISEDYMTNLQKV